MKKAKWCLMLVCLVLCLTACSANRRCGSCNQTIPADSAYCMYCGTVQNSGGSNGILGGSTVKDYTILDKGTCNQNVYWEIRSDGTLYIGGTGTVPNYESHEVDGQIAPWKASALYEEIKVVKVGDGITAIGDNSFNMSLDAIYIGHNVILSDDWGGYNAKEIYMPLSMKDVYSLLPHVRKTIVTTPYGERYTEYESREIFVYFEGTQEQWDESLRLNRHLNGDNLHGVIVNYNCTYTCE